MLGRAKTSSRIGRKARLGRLIQLQFIARPRYHGVSALASVKLAAAVWDLQQHRHTASFDGPSAASHPIRPAEACLLMFTGTSRRHVHPVRILLQSIRITVCLCCGHGTQWLQWVSCCSPVTQGQGNGRANHDMQVCA
jgi:hypothetical protein